MIKVSVESKIKPSFTKDIISAIESSLGVHLSKDQIDSGKFVARGVKGGLFGLGDSSYDIRIVRSFTDPSKVVANIRFSDDYRSQSDTQYHLSAKGGRSSPLARKLRSLGVSSRSFSDAEVESLDMKEKMSRSELTYLEAHGLLDKAVSRLFVSGKLRGEETSNPSDRTSQILKDYSKKISSLVNEMDLELTRADVFGKN